MISPRNLGFDRLTAVMVVGPLTTAAIAALPSALLDHLTAPVGEQSRWKGTPGRWARVSPSNTDELARLASTAITTVGGSVDALAMLKAGFAHTFSGLPIHCFVSDDSIAFTFSHSRFDGTSATAAIDDLLARMAGEPIQSNRMIEKRPLVVILRRFGMLSPAGVRRARGMFRERNRQFPVAYQLTDTLEKATSVEITELARVDIDAETARRIAAVVDPAAQGQRLRPPTRVKIAALALGALRAINRESAEFRVVMAIDARRYLRPGTTVDGNLSPSVPLGLLSSSDWSASALMGRIADCIKTGVPVAWLLAMAIRGTKSALIARVPGRGTPRGTPRTPFEIHVSLPATSLRVPQSLVPAGQRSHAIGLPSHTAAPFGVWLDVVESGDQFALTLWDDTGLLEVGDFESQVRAQISAWTAAT